MKKLMFLITFAIPVAIFAVEVDNSHVAQEGCAVKEEPKPCPPKEECSKCQPPKKECNKCQPPKPKCEPKEKCKKRPPSTPKCAPPKPQCDN